MARVGGDGTPKTVIGGGEAVLARDVVLCDAGADPAAVADVVRSMTGLEASAAKVLVARVPCAVRTRIAPALAEALRARLVAAGGRVEVREHGAAPAVPGPLDVEPASAAAAAFDVVLVVCGRDKIAVIKAIRAATGLGLREAKAMAESPGSTLKAGVGRAEASQIERQLADAGAFVELRASEVAIAIEDESAQVELFLQRSGPNKLLAIKEIRAVTGLGLKAARDLVESAPCSLKKNVDRDAAEQVQRRFAEVGAVVELR